MALFTERNNLRKEIEKTYFISPEKYELLFKICSRYFINLAWKFPCFCPDDGASIFSYNEHDLITELKFDIPNLINNEGFIAPVIIKDPFTNEETPNYDQYAVIDLIEYMFNHIKDYQEGYHHRFFNHNHIQFIDTFNSRFAFLEEINKMCKKTGLLYELKNNGEIERVVLNEMLIKDVKRDANLLQDNSLKELINDSIYLFLKPGSKNLEFAVEKIWDAFERAKTYYTELDKKASTNKIIENISEGQITMVGVLNAEFLELTSLGNKFRIRHHETDKIDFASDNHREYFYNRCLALLSLMLKYIN